MVSPEANVSVKRETSSVLVVLPIGRQTAAADILLKARLLDAGNTVSYNQSKDEYHLEEHQRNYTFGRKILSDGGRSSQYACDMAAADHTFVTAVADNMRQYTKREVAQARNARELIARLGYPSSQTTIDMLDAGIFKCDVTKQDVFEMPMQSLDHASHL